MIRVRFSVAICTFNGERYLPHQLDSILRQTVLPDELVVCDDASSDGTETILREFQARAPFPVHLHRNPTNLGVNLNFGQAIEHCTGDWIFLADQDDEWLPEKLMLFRDAIAQYPDRRFWASDAEVVDNELRPLGYRLWENLPFPRKARVEFHGPNAVRPLFAGNRIPGATCALHKSLKALVLPIGGNRYCIHDYWINFLAAATVPCGLIETPLIRYRQHPDQQVGSPRMTLRTRMALARRRNADSFAGLGSFFRELHDRLSIHRGLLRSTDTLARLAAKVDLCQVQARMRTVNRLQRALLVASLALAGHYHRYEHGLKGIAADLLF